MEEEEEEQEDEGEEEQEEEEPASTFLHFLFPVGSTERNRHRASEQNKGARRQRNGPSKSG